MNKRSWALYGMRQNRKTENTPSQLQMYDELTENCFPGIFNMEEINEIMVTEYKVKDLLPVEGIEPTNPPPKLDIAIPELKLGFRLNGGVHYTKRNRLKDEDQYIVLTGNGWSISTVTVDDREELWCKKEYVSKYLSTYPK